MSNGPGGSIDIEHPRKRFSLRSALSTSPTRGSSTTSVRSSILGISPTVQRLQSPTQEPSASNRRQSTSGSSARPATFNVGNFTNAVAGTVNRGWPDLQQHGHHHKRRDDHRTAATSSARSTTREPSTSNGTITNYAYLVNVGGTIINSGTIANIVGCSVVSCGTIANNGIVDQRARRQHNQPGQLRQLQHEPPQTRARHPFERWHADQLELFHQHAGRDDHQLRRHRQHGHPLEHGLDQQLRLDHQLRASS